jgi:hypothetical protein
MFGFPVAACHIVPMDDRLASLCIGRQKEGETEMTGLPELTEEQKRKVRVKINKFLNEKNYPEAAKLMVAMAVTKIDPDKFAHDLIQKIREYQRQKQ